MAKSIKYYKLIRDKIPEIIEVTGKKACTKILDSRTYKEELDKKLLEEVQEYVEADNLEELADIVEVIYGILQSKGVSIEEFEKVRLKKVEERGAFEKRLFLDEVVEE